MTSNEIGTLHTEPATGHQFVGNHFESALTKIIATRVRELRLERSMTVAKLADDVGISKGMLSKIENGRSSPSL